MKEYIFTRDFENYKKGDSANYLSCFWLFYYLKKGIIQLKQEQKNNDRKKGKK